VTPVGCSGTAYELVDLAALWPTLGPLPRDAEDALQAFNEGRALAFRGPHGTFVISLEPGKNPGELEAFVLLAIASQHGAFEAAEPAVLAIALDLSATSVAFRSVRRGWARRLGPTWMPRGNSEFWRHCDEREKTGRPRD
jgi:hypothetical protein